MSSLREVITKEKNKITIKNNVRIINTSDGDYVLKKEDIDLTNTYKYLLSRAFDYFPKRIDKINNYDVYEYIEDIKEPNEQKMIDLLNLLCLLHSKTTFYKEIDIDKYKEIYENIINKCNYLYYYYLDLANIIEEHVYMSPSEYLLLRNISNILESFDYIKKETESWYELIKDKRRVRYVTIHNNLELNHYLKKEKSYFISWGKNKIDMPIYDLVILYKNHYLDFDFNPLFKYYESRYPLSIEEKKLLFILLYLPEKIEFTMDEYSDCIQIRRFIDYIYKTKELILNYDNNNKEPL